MGSAPGAGQTANGTEPVPRDPATADPGTAHNGALGTAGNGTAANATARNGTAGNGAAGNGTHGSRNRSDPAPGDPALGKPAHGNRPQGNPQEATPQGGTRRTGAGTAGATTAADPGGGDAASRQAATARTAPAAPHLPGPGAAPGGKSGGGAAKAVGRRRDRHGLELSGLGAGPGAEEALAAYERAVDALLFFRGDVADTVTLMRQVAPGAPMGQVFAAYLGVLGTEEKQARSAREELARFRAEADHGRFTERERAHLQAASVWLAGDLRRAGELLREVSIRWPGDTLALAVGHQNDFFSGDAASLRDRVAGVLTAWDEQDPHHGPLLGMFGFGLEESGHYEQALETALAAVERNPHDVWAVHAVVHCHEMRGRFAEGIRYLDARVADWGAGNMMAVHNWWHYALYALESGDVHRALEIYDAAIHHPESAGVALELLDAAALLWRLYLDGGTASAAVGDRWEVLADAWAARADGPHYAFNDTHAVMAYLGAGRLREAEEVVAARAEWAARPHPGVTNHGMTARIGLPVCRALIAFAREQYERTVELLLPVRGRLQTFGGSHAQRDAVQRTLVEAALRARRTGLARTLLSERLGLRPTSPYNWLGQARLADQLGRAAMAVTAREKASRLAAAGARALADRPSGAGV